MVRKHSVMDVLLEAHRQSENSTIDLVVEHGELPGIKPEMLEWWFSKVSLFDNYKRWYPGDHVSFIWKIPPAGKVLSGAVSIVTEKIGKFETSLLYIRPEDPPGWCSISDENDRRIAWFKDEVVGITPGGTILRSVFRFPAKTPEHFLKAMHDHSKGEVKRFTEFLPQMYKENADRV